MGVKTAIAWTDITSVEAMSIFGLEELERFGHIGGFGDDDGCQSLKEHVDPSNSYYAPAVTDLTTALVMSANRTSYVSFQPQHDPSVAVVDLNRRIPSFVESDASLPIDKTGKVPKVQTSRNLNGYWRKF